ncbi:GNAT family N-acetyltransferase [Actinokineospora inagensis]|uniref:GNAT family N-acetyltransferase n=1 Tax=Actinokineospora inagensis TaxID=103730 RepID=UPI0006864D00|nr:GNAT family N-acetyltransferase [Actinokineospora inagensis]
MSVVTRAGLSDVDRCAGVVAASFASLPQTAWLIDTPADRVPVLAADFAIFVAHAVEFGHVDVLGDHAVAVWFYRDRELPAPADYDARVAAATGRYAERFHLLDAAFDGHHPVAPHHHLALLAVEPGYQNQGLGVALLRHHHAWLDAEGVSAFLEASTVESVRLYRREGYEAMGEAYGLPDGGPLMWPLWRAARS